MKCRVCIGQRDFHVEIGNSSLFCLLFRCCNVYVLFVFGERFRVCVCVFAFVCLPAHVSSCLHGIGFVVFSELFAFGHVVVCV